MHAAVAGGGHGREALGFIMRGIREGILRSLMTASGEAERSRLALRQTRRTMA